MPPNLASQQLAQPRGSLLGRFYRFLKCPIYSVNVPLQKQPLRDILRLYALILILTIPLALMVSSLSKKLSTGHAINDIADKPWLLFFFGVVIAPLLEEILFRLPLRYTPTNLTLPTFLWIFTILSLLVGTKVIPAALLLPLLCIAVLGCLFLRIWLKEKVPATPIHKLYEKWIGLLFYSCAIIFGLVHITNFQLSSGQAFLFTPLLVSPQILIGVLLGFVRLKYGFWWCVFIHTFHNGLFIGQMLLYQTALGAMSASQKAERFINSPKLVRAIFGMFWLALLSVCLVVVVRMVLEWRAEGHHPVND